MQCELCASVGRLRVGYADEPEHHAMSILGGTCDTCGRPVAGNAGARVVEKLTQLARFGLTGQTLLARRRAS